MWGGEETLGNWEELGMGAASFVKDKESVRKFLTVAATIVVPYALWPLVMVWAVLHFSALGVKRLIA
ncbi:hypothetical protein GCM10027068_24050 [Prescottella soli]